MEETGRLIRYKYLNRIAKKENAYIVTGHHSNDYLETLLIHLIRGGGYSSFNALPIFRNDIFRPLMRFPVLEIRKIIESEKWKLFEDESNESTIFLRNRLRKKIVPLLIQEGLNPEKIYDNFQNENEFDNSESLNKRKTQSFLKIDNKSLIEINLRNLKLTLDAYANVLRIHPFTKKILLELKKELEKNASFLIENKEVILWKNPTSDLILIPKNSIALRAPLLKQKDLKQYLHWNHKIIEIPNEFSLGHILTGLKILKNNKHYEISELFREKQIPTPIRQILPILFKENEPTLILFSLWDDRIRDYQGDLYL